MTSSADPTSTPATSEGVATAAPAVPRWAIHRRLYDWVLHWATTPYALPALILMSFAESSFFPVPPDLLLIPLVLAVGSKWWRLALWCTLASVAGGILGYGIGAGAWDLVGVWIVEHVAHAELVDLNGSPDVALPSSIVNLFGEDWLGGTHLFQVYDYWNASIVFVFGLTPLPYKLVTITAGFAGVDIPRFILASLASRGLRFFMVAGIIRVWGPPARTFIEKYFNWLTIAFVVLLIGGFAVIKFLL